jgi:large subunit ribosomal protein L35
MTKKAKTKVKLKTNRGAAKRFKLTGTGKVRFRRAFRNHIKTKKSSQKVRHQRANGVLQECDAKLVRRMLCVE